MSPVDPPWRGVIGSAGAGASGQEKDSDGIAGPPGHRDELAALREALEAAQAARRRAERELSDVRRELVRVTARNEALIGEVAGLRDSTSWRVTAPLRWVRQASAAGRLRPMRVARGVFVRLARAVVARPLMRQVVGHALSRFPGIRARLRGLATRAGLAGALDGAAIIPSHRPSPPRSNGSLSPKAAQVFNELISAMEKSTK